MACLCQVEGVKLNLIGEVLTGLMFSNLQFVPGICGDFKINQTKADGLNETRRVAQVSDTKI
jgi:hypothetical protein